MRTLLASSHVTRDVGYASYGQPARPNWQMGRGCKTQNACSCFECFVFPTMRIRRSATLSARASYPPRVTQTRCVLTQTTHRPSLWPKKSYRPPASWGKEGRSVGAFQPKSSQKGTLFLPRAVIGDGSAAGEKANFFSILDATNPFLHPISTVAT